MTETKCDGNRPSPICPECSAYMDVVYVNGIEWLKCPTCARMDKVSKRIINRIKVA